MEAELQQLITKKRRLLHCELQDQDQHHTARSSDPLINFKDLLADIRKNKTSKQKYLSSMISLPTHQRFHTIGNTEDLELLQITSAMSEVGRARNIEIIECDVIQQAKINQSLREEIEELSKAISHLQREVEARRKVQKENVVEDLRLLSQIQSCSVLEKTKLVKLHLHQLSNRRSIQLQQLSNSAIKYHKCQKVLEDEMVDQLVTIDKLRSKNVRLLKQIQELDEQHRQMVDKIEEVQKRSMVVVDFYTIENYTNTVQNIRPKSRYALRGLTDTTDRILEFFTNQEKLRTDITRSYEQLLGTKQQLSQKLQKLTTHLQDILALNRPQLNEHVNTQYLHYYPDWDMNEESDPNNYDAKVSAIRRILKQLDARVAMVLQKILTAARKPLRHWRKLLAPSVYNQFCIRLADIQIREELNSSDVKSLLKDKIPKWERYGFFTSWLTRDRFLKSNLSRERINNALNNVMAIKEKNPNSCMATLLLDALAALEKSAYSEYSNRLFNSLKRLSQIIRIQSNAPKLVNIFRRQRRQPKDSLIDIRIKMQQTYFGRTKSQISETATEQTVQTPNDNMFTNDAADMYRKLRRCNRLGGKFSSQILGQI